MPNPLASLAFLAGFFPPLSIAAANAAILCFLLVALGLALAGKESFRPFRTPVDIPLLVFMAVWLAASLAGMTPGRSLGKVLSQARFVVFYLLLWSAGGERRGDALKGYLWGAAAAVLYGLLQSAAVTADLAGRFPALFSLGRPDDALLGLKAGRVHGSVHPLTYAELVLPFFMFGMGALLETKDRRKTFAAAGWVLAAGAALLLSQSRGPWLGAALGAAVLAVLHPRRLRLAAPVALLAASLAFHPGLRGRAATISENRPDESKSDRLALWNNAWQVVKRYPWTGAGPGCLKRAVELHRAEPGFMPTPRGRDGDAHNQFLHHWAERGLQGPLALLWLMGVPLLAAWKALKEPIEGGLPRWVLWGLLAAFAAFPAINLTERVFDDAEPAMVFWILASLLVRTPGGRAAGSVPGRSGGVPRTSG